MSKVQDEIAELMALQREAQAPKARREKTRNKTRAAGRGESASDDVEPASDDETVETSDEADGKSMSDLERSMKELAQNIETAVQGLEESAREQPFLTAMTAFTLGLVVGQLFTRR